MSESESESEWVSEWVSGWVSEWVSEREKKEIKQWNKIFGLKRVKNFLHYCFIFSLGLIIIKDFLVIGLPFPLCLWSDCYMFWHVLCRPSLISFIYFIRFPKRVAYLIFLNFAMTSKHLFFSLFRISAKKFFTRNKILDYFNPYSKINMALMISFEKNITIDSCQFFKVAIIKHYSIVYGKEWRSNSLINYIMQQKIFKSMLLFSKGSMIL